MSSNRVRRSLGHEGGTFSELRRGSALRSVVELDSSLSVSRSRSACFALLYVALRCVACFLALPEVRPCVVPVDCSCQGALPIRSCSCLAFARRLPSIAAWKVEGGNLCFEGVHELCRVDCHPLPARGRKSSFPARALVLMRLAGLIRFSFLLAVCIVRTRKSFIVLGPFQTQKKNRCKWEKNRRLDSVF